MLSLKTGKLLIVEDDEAQLDGLVAALELLGYRATGFTSAKAALAALQEDAFDLALVDLNMPEMDGIAFLLAAREIDPDMAGIVLTGDGSIDSAVEAMQAGAVDYMVKPLNLRDVPPVLVRALNLRRLHLQNIDFQQEAGIYALSMLIRVTLGFDAILEKVADAAMGHPQVSGLSLLLRNEDADTLRVVLARGDDADRDKAEGIVFTPEIARWVQSSLEQRSRPGELSSIQAALPLSLPEMPCGTSLPMLAGSKFIGILHFTPKQRSRPVSPGHIKALNILAGAAAAALEAASSYEHLRSEEARSRRLSESAQDVIFCYQLHPDARFRYINPAVHTLLDYAQQDFYTAPDLILRIVHPDDRHLMEELLHRSTVTGSLVTLRWVHRKGQVVWVEVRSTFERDPNGRLIAMDSIARDITNRKHLEEQLLQSQKMEAIGLLAGGVAHDFNNLLTVILGYSELILVDDAPSAGIAKKIAQISKAAEQSANLTRQLLAFGRRQLVHPTILDLNTIVKGSAKMLRRIIGEDIELVTDLDAGLGNIKADAAQMEQILMNLIVNAKFAMPEGGRIILVTRNEVLDGGRVDGIDACNPGPCVKLTIADTGCGMDAPTQARIFEPFFTTKAAGTGTGLGLSIVYGIVKQCEGQIRVFSNPGQGARFEIHFPLSQETEETAAVPDLPLKERTESETILVVEDDPGVRELIATLLEKQGYAVLIAHDGEEAVRICEHKKGEIGLVLIDLILPGMSGIKLVELLRRLNFGMRVLFMSGYAGAGSHAKLTPGKWFIQKPFTQAALIDRIRDVLDDASDQVPIVGAAEEQRREMAT